MRLRTLFQSARIFLPTRCDGTFGSYSEASGPGGLLASHSKPLQNKNKIVKKSPKYFKIVIFCYNFFFEKVIRFQNNMNRKFFEKNRFSAFSGKNSRIYYIEDELFLSKEKRYTTRSQKSKKVAGSFLYNQINCKYGNFLIILQSCVSFVVHPLIGWLESSIPPTNCYAKTIESFVHR